MRRGETPDSSPGKLLPRQARADFSPPAQVVNHHASERPRALEVHIEELVLHGFAPADRSRIGAAVERELGRLLAQTGLPPAFIQGMDRRERVDGGAFTAGPGAGADAIGARIAQAVYRGLAR